MNRSYSKIRYIQESNIKLEKRMLKEQEVSPNQTKDEYIVKPIIDEGYKIVNELSLSDGMSNEF